MPQPLLRTDRSFGLQKLVALHNLLLHRAHGTWGWSLDGDAIIMNHSVSILEILNGTNADIVHASEPQ